MKNFLRRGHSPLPRPPPRPTSSTPPKIGTPPHFLKQSYAPVFSLWQTALGAKCRLHQWHNTLTSDQWSTMSVQYQAQHRIGNVSDRDTVLKAQDRPICTQWLVIWTLHMTQCCDLSSVVFVHCFFKLLLLVARQPVCFCAYCLTCNGVF